MGLAIAMNLIAMAVLVGGWSAAVWALYKKLGDPGSAAADASSAGAAAWARTPRSRREPVLTGSHSA